MGFIFFKARIICFTLLMASFYGWAQTVNQQKLDFNQLAVEFLQMTKESKNTESIQKKLAQTTLKDLENGLQTDTKKLAFWVNIYNAYIQVILSEKPDLYKDRQQFFGANQIKIAGEMISFAKIEHGIIRKSQWPLGLGLIRKWFPNKFERKLRVDKRDYRIHFALNCGAKDCPPVAIYTADRIEEQLTKGTEMYLKRTSNYDAKQNEVAVTSLFNWFRGDFGCKKGVKKILKEQEIIPNAKGVDLRYKNYDWTLDLDNWINL